MRIAARAAGTLALALASAAARPAGAQEAARGILLAATVSEEGSVVVDPVAVLLPNGFARPDDDPESEGYARFSEQWLSPGTRYEVLSRGERIGGVTLDAPEPMACYGMHVRGRLDVARALDAGWEGLAGDGLPAQAGAPWLREPTRAEKRDLDRMAAALFHAHGIDVSQRPQGDTAAAALVVHPGARPLLVASYASRSDDGLLSQAALLVIAEEGRNGYRPAYAWFHEGMDADVEARTLVDAADLDGDGMPELVVRNGYYESWSFTILQRTPNGWIEAYHGGGGGC